MPKVVYRSQQFTAIGEILEGSGVPPGYVSRSGASLRTVGNDGVNFDRSGTVVDAAEFTTSIIPMSALSEVFGTQVKITSPDGKDASSAVKVQITLDGSTYLRWDGAAWSAAGADQFNTLEEFNDNCASLTLSNPKKLGFKFKLSSFNSLAPTLVELITYVEFESLTFLDLFETFHDLITDVFQVPVTRQVVLEAASDSFTLDSEYSTVAAGDFKVFNLSTDANKNANIYSSYNSNSKVITLSAEQAQGSVLEVTFQGTAPVQVARADEMIEIAEIPVTLVTIEDVEEAQNKMVGHLSEYKIGATSQLVRTRLHPTYRAALVRIEHASRSPREALAGVARMEETFNYGVVLLSTGEALKTVERSAAGLRDYPGQSHFSGVFEAMVFFYDHAPTFKEYKALGKLKVNIGGKTTANVAINDWTEDHVEIGG
tara:strand:+ start:792 stop:2078 length:1287 start_codon:yes stop_codon:yes gene_type:complete